MTVLTAQGLSKRFGDLIAVDGISFDVAEGEILTFVGPSGCGKTTTLRMIAGLEEPDSGEIVYLDQSIVSVRENIFVPIHKREMGIVFQSYAVWPHMTVFQNVAYPLKLRRLSRKEIEDRVSRVLDLVGLTEFRDQPTPLLSGGQQQRVALARALVYEPGLLLLDEPFSNLDAKLKEQMRIELKVLQRRLGISVVFVTHDQVEALTMSDKIAVMNAGRIEQLGTPQEVYNHPRTYFVHDFLGNSTFLTGKIIRWDGDFVMVSLQNSSCTILSRSASDELLNGFNAGTDVRVVLRPEDVMLGRPDKADTAHNVLEGVVKTIMFMGNKYEVAVELENGDLITCYSHDRDVRHLVEGATACLTVPLDATYVWPL